MPGPTAGRAPIVVPDGAQFEERSYANAAGSRAYKLYIPSGYTAAVSMIIVPKARIVGVRTSSSP